jgi:hypothetical protein
MIAHTQTIFGNGDAGATPGNCMQAALASLLDLPLDQVPHFALFHDWYKAMKLWIDGQGKRLRVFTDSQEVREYWEYVGVPAFPLNLAPNSQMLIATGQSHNGPWLHVVAWKAGQLVHDTHPNRRGLKGSPTEYWQITDGNGAT